MTQYRKKPVVIEAWAARDLIRVASSDWKALPKSVADAYEKGTFVFCQDGIYINTLEGSMKAESDDVVIRGVKGEFYPCKPDIFEATYDRVEGAA